MTMQLQYLPAGENGTKLTSQTFTYKWKYLGVHKVLMVLLLW